MSQELSSLVGKVEMLDSKLDTVVVEQAKQTVILEKNHEAWVEHMKRTKINEDRLEKFERYIYVFHALGVLFMAALGVYKTIAPSLQ